MCGIVGCIGNKNIISVLIDGLEKLEYRGYDSYGFCAFKEDSHFLYKDVGIISQNTRLNGYAHAIDEDFISGIGHTRWATHGEVSKENSHPQHDEDETIFVVHNGTVDNSPSDVLDTQYIVQQLQLRSTKHWMNIESPDRFTEPLCERLPLETEDYLLIVNSVIQKLEGDNAFLVSFSNLPDLIFCATKGSTSLLVTDNGHVSSDSYAIAGKAKEAQRIKNSVVCLSSKGIISSVKPFNSSAKIEIVPEQQEDGLSEPHFMLQEIKEQSYLVEDAGNYDVSGCMLASPPKRLNLIGCGSSYYAAMWAKNWFEKLAKIPTTVAYGSEATYHLHDPEAADIYISQSGETKDIIHASHSAKSGNDHLITNNINSYLGNSILKTIDIGAGPEYGVAATKTFTMTCFTLWEMAWHWADEKSRDVVGVDNAAEGLVAGINYVLDREEAIRTLAKMIAQYDNVLFLGRYCDYPIALEGALKLKEVSYIHAEGMPAAEMKHGPIALVDEKTPSIFVVNTDLHLDSIISNMREIKSRGGKIFAISDSVTHDRVAEVADWAFRCHNMCSLAMRPLASNVVLQLLAYHVAVEKGLNPDRPRNLAKSVTV